MSESTFLLLLIVVVVLFAKVATMANRRGLSVLAWWLLSLFITPLGSMFLLALLFRPLDRS